MDRELVLDAAESGQDGGIDQLALSQGEPRQVVDVGEAGFDDIAAEVRADRGEPVPDLLAGFQALDAVHQLETALIPVSGTGCGARRRQWRGGVGHVDCSLPS